MRNVTLTTIVVSLAAMLALQPTRVTADAPAVEGNLTVSALYGDVVRAANHMSVEVSQSLFYNNSGTSRFSGNITLWFQQGARISSRFCGGQQDHVVRVEYVTKFKCLQLQAVDSQYFTVLPFAAGEFMSYFGERHALELNVTSRNTSANTRLGLNVTLGQETKTSSKQQSVGNVTLNTSSDKLGAVAFVTWGPPRNLTMRQMVNVSNPGGLNETLDIGLLNIPSGWHANVLRDNSEISSLYLPAEKYANIVLNITAPSYLLHVYMEHELTSTDQKGEAPLTVTSLFPYNTTYVEFLVYARENDKVSVGGSLESHGGQLVDEQNGTTRYMILGFDIMAGSTASITSTWVPPPFVMPLWAVAAIVIVAAFLVGYPLWRRVRPEAEEEVEQVITEEPEPKPVSVEELRVRRDTLSKSLARLENDEKEGNIPKDLAVGMKQEVEKDLAEVERQLGSMRSVEARKKAILKALRRLERDHKEGKVDDAVYASLKARYETEAMKILKQLDTSRDEKQGGEPPDK